MRAFIGIALTAFIFHLALAEWAGSTLEACSSGSPPGRCSCIKSQLRWSLAAERNMLPVAQTFRDTIRPCFG